MDANIVLLDGIKTCKNLKPSNMRLSIKYAFIFLSYSIISCNTDESLLNNEDMREPYTGNWLVSENSTLLGFRTYDVDILIDLNDDLKINILKFYKLGINDGVFAKISDSENNTFTIPLQNIDNNIVSGSAKLNANELDLSYYINDGNNTDTVSAKYSRN